jgi:hypothetical protein
VLADVIEGCYDSEMMQIDLNTAVELVETTRDHEDLADHLHSLIERTLATGLCPRCMTDLDDDGFCAMCGATFHGPVDAG